MHCLSPESHPSDSLLCVFLGIFAVETVYNFVTPCTEGKSDLKQIQGGGEGVCVNDTVGGIEVM